MAANRALIDTQAKHPRSLPGGLDERRGWVVCGRYVSYRNPREGGDPSFQHGTWPIVERWLPAFAGMTKQGGLRTVGFVRATVLNRHNGVKYL
jgi:hypothetical protein